MAKRNLNTAPNGNKKSGSKDPKDWVDYNFVEMRLLKSDEKEFDEWLKSSGEEVSDSVGFFAENGYKFSISHDENNDCYIAAMTCKNTGDSNYGFVLTSRHSNWYTAIALCVYKTQVMCENLCWDTQERVNNFG